MRQTTLRSRCECQSLLVAVLNESRYVIKAHVVDPDGNKETAPAHSIGSQKERFDIGWLCPVCGRNTLRSFSADSLEWVEVAMPVPPAPPAPAAPPAPTV